MPQPILRTERLVLVPLDDRHLKWEIELDSDPEVLRYIAGRAHTPDEVKQAHAERMELSKPVDGLGYWTAFTAPPHASVADAETDERFAGLLMLPPLRDDEGIFRHDIADLGFRMRQKFWFQGLATEASGNLLQYAFMNLGLTAVVANTMTVNSRSEGVLKALGLRYGRSYFKPNTPPEVEGADEGHVEYVITRDTWFDQHPDGEW